MGIISLSTTTVHIQLACRNSSTKSPPQGTRRLSLGNQDVGYPWRRYPRTASVSSLLVSELFYLEIPGFRRKNECYGGPYIVFSHSYTSRQSVSSRSNTGHHLCSGDFQGSGTPTAHALRCGPETSVTSPLRWRWFDLRGHGETYIQSSRPW